MSQLVRVLFRRFEGREPPMLAPQEAIILQALIADGPAYGLQLVNRPCGGTRRGTIYVLLARLVKKGFVASREVVTPAGSRGPPRRLYHATAFGRRVLAAWEASAARLAEVLACKTTGRTIRSTPRRGESRTRGGHGTRGRRGVAR